MLQCYDSQLIDAPTVLQRPLPADVRGWLSKSKPMLWHHINGTAVTTRSNSQYNPAEITLVVNYIGQLRLEGVLATSIMVIAPYSAQVDHISTALTNTFPDYLVDVRTIDSSEGNENAILLLSLTADQNQFISDPGRFTVALTRGKHQVIVIGDCKAYFRDTTDGTNNDYKDLQRYIADRNGVLKGNFSQAVPAVYYGEGGFTIDRWIPNLCASALATSAGVTKAAVMSALSGLAKSASTAANPLSPVVLPRAAPARLSAATKSAEKEDGEESEESEPEPVPQRPDHIPPAASSAQQQPPCIGSTIRSASTTS